MSQAIAKEGAEAKKEQVCDLDKWRLFFETPLVMAVRNGDLAGVQSALAAGADIHADNNKAFLFAAEEGCTDILQTLIASGAKVRSAGGAVLQSAAANGHTETVLALLAAGASVNEHGKEDSALALAASRGRKETVLVLLSAGADVHAQDDLPVRWAKLNGYTEVVNILRAAMAKSEVQTHSPAYQTFFEQPVAKRCLETQLKGNE